MLVVFGAGHICHHTLRQLLTADNILLSLWQVSAVVFTCAPLRYNLLGLCDWHLCKQVIIPQVLPWSTLSLWYQQFKCSHDSTLITLCSQIVLTLR